MDLRHEFTVPAPIDQTWSAFNDIESVAVCFPGAKVTTVEGDTFNGTVKVKLGPIALVYNGTGTFVEKDESAHRMVIDAKGKDKRGNGTAGALVTATMTEQGSSTHVEVLTDLNITGKPAQFGRGVMEDVSNKLLGQFTACLEQKVGDSGPADAEAVVDEPHPRHLRPTRVRLARPTLAHSTTCATSGRAGRTRTASRRTTRPSTWGPRCCRSWRRPTGSRQSAYCSCCGYCGPCSVVDTLGERHRPGGERL